MSGPTTAAGRAITQWAEIGDGSITRLVVECEDQARAEVRQRGDPALRTALERLVNAIQATDWDRGSEGAEIASALIQARVADLATLEYARHAEPDA